MEAEKISPFEIFKKSVYDFCGENALTSIRKYFNRGYVLKKVDFTDDLSIELQKEICRTKTADEYKRLKWSDLQILSNLGNYAKAGNIDAMHSFLIVQNVEKLSNGIYYIEKDMLYRFSDGHDKTVLEDILQAGDRGDEMDIANIPALLIIVAEHDLKMTKYKELGYEYCLIEAGMMLQNLYIAGANTSLAIRPLGSYSKIKVIDRLGLNNRKYTPMITAIVGSNGE